MSNELKTGDDYDSKADSDVCKDAEAKPATPKGGRLVTPDNQKLIDEARRMPK